MQRADAVAIRGVSLTKKFRSGGADLVIFSNLSFEVNRGERLALVGESGAGKSTLSALLMENFLVQHISVGDLLRRITKNDTTHP